MKQLRLPRILDELWRLLLIVVGAVLAGLGFSLFQVPYNIAAGGVSGIAILINHFTGWPISVMYLVMNVPLFVLGFFYLGRWRFLVSTALAVLLFSFTTGVGNQYLRDTIPVFNEAFAGKWNWVNQYKAFDKISTELIAAVQAGGDVPDLADMGSSSIIELYNNGAVQDLSEWASAQPWYADMDPAAISACTGPDGGLYCIPAAERPHLVYVWKDRFPNGYPTTPEEFMSEAERLKAEGLYAITFFGSTDFNGNGFPRAVWTTISSFGGLPKSFNCRSLNLYFRSAAMIFQ